MNDIAFVTWYKKLLEFRLAYLPAPAHSVIQTRAHNKEGYFPLFEEPSKYDLEKN